MTDLRSTTAGARRGLEVLLAHAVDYAGLFPPAALGMPEAAAEYDAYLRGPHAWALGRFVVPVGRLEELARVRDRSGAATPRPWSLSALLGDALVSETERVRAWNAVHESRAGIGAREWVAPIDTVEARTPDLTAVRAVLAATDPALERYLEIPIATDPAPLVREIGARGGRCKVRTGGVTADAFPATADLVRFLERCVAEGVAFKATAGLHHPVRASYRLTYASDAPRGVMFGFLNVFLATAFLAAGVGRDAATAVLEETDLETMRFDDRGAEWRGHRLSLAELAAARELGVRSFGSCSFREPIDDLAAGGLL